MPAPATSSYPISRTCCHHTPTGQGPASTDSATTSSTAGASLMPDSASSMAASRGLIRNRRKVENTAAASVEDSTAP
jgi:hypothetical protein